MKRNFAIKSLLLAIATLASITSFAISTPTVTSQIYQKAQENKNWKLAFLTGKNGQIVFMNVSPATNPKNEIGSETHQFDQVILIAKGKGKAVLNGKETEVKTGDMIFIPQGTIHNIINLDIQAPLKIISFYSANDIPEDAKYATKKDEK